MSQEDSAMNIVFGALRAQNIQMIPAGHPNNEVHVSIGGSPWKITVTPIKE